MDKVYVIMAKDWFDGHFESNELYEYKFHLTKEDAENTLNKLNNIDSDHNYIYTRKDGVNYAIRLEINDDDYFYYKNESDECKNNYYWEQEGYEWHYVEELVLA